MPDGETNASIALKDLNFKRKLHLGPQKKALLMEQVEKDTRVRSKNGLLILGGGWEGRDKSNQKTPTDSNFKTMCSGWQAIISAIIGE